MTPETHPAVSEAMREAVARDDAREKRLADIVDRYVTDCTLVHRTLTEEDIWLLEGLAFGPLASEIARLTGERDEAVKSLNACIADMERGGTCKRIYSDTALGRELEAAEAKVTTLTGERDAAIKDRDKLDLLVASYRSPPRLYTLCDMQASLDRAEAAEADLTRMRAETEMLRAALEAAETRFTDISAGRAFQPRLHAATGATEARTALSNPEQTDA